MNSLPLQTGTKTFPHSSQKPHSLRQNSIPFLDASSLFHLFHLDLFHSSTGPLVHWSPFLILYAFHFSFRSCSTFAMQHWLSILLLLSSSYHFSFPLSHWLSNVEAYPESYLELRFSLRSVLYKVSQPLSCSLASSMQFSLVSSLPRFALRPPTRSLPSTRTALLGCCDSL